MADSKQAGQCAGLMTQRQTDICNALNTVDATPFITDEWQRDGGGGGITKVIMGDSFEKGGVNTSEVHGIISDDERPMFQQLVAKVDPLFQCDASTEFYATGISLVIHPKNPFVPTVHANFRYFEITNQQGESLWWVGGGADLTPYYLFDDDAVHFHGVLKSVCEDYQKGSYSTFKDECDRYFYIPHRQETRGVGGIFFDYLNHDFDDLFNFISNASMAFVDAYIPIVKKRKGLDYSDDHVEWQRFRRGRYAEFNLVYDRGTLFGLKTGGRIESILMSMPPQANWGYNFQVDEGAEEAKLQQIIKNPKVWV